MFGIIMRWEGRSSFVSGINKAGSLLLPLSYAKVSNTKDMLIGRPARGYSCVPT